MSLEARALGHLARVPHEPHLHVKRTLGVQARELLEAVDADPAAVAVMLERHAIELPEDRFSFLPSADPDAEPPARDPYVEAAAGAPPSALNDALVQAEVAAATAAEVPDSATRQALARFAADRLVATADLEGDEDWGAQPVDVSRYGALMALPAADRVQQLLGEGGGSDEDAAL